MTQDQQQFAHDLGQDLRSLAMQVPVRPLDLPALCTVARRRVRRRRMVAAIPVLLVVLAIPFLPSLLPAERHGLATISVAPSAVAPTTAGPMVLEALHVSAAIAPGELPLPGLTLRVDSESVPFAGTMTSLPLTWTATGPQPVAFEQPRYAEEVTAEQGSGVVGVTEGFCSYWEPDGSFIPHSCPPPFRIELQPGESMSTDLQVAGTVESGRAAPGTYRFTVPVGDTGHVDVVLTVTVGAGDGRASG